ncbi:hypothetical protein H0H92_007474 [Tricholoma furcatifolium]|nr:hypothetical protein H0H92_007474 [Tricholoma furcatifolium]
MAVHPPPRHARRQETAQPSNIPGVENSASTAAAIATATGGTLALDTNVPTGASGTAPNLATSTPVSTITPSPSSAAPTTAASATPSTAAAASSPISMSTVIGACVGAFIGAIALIILGLWFYRRYSRQLKESARSRRALGTARNNKGEQGRRRSHLEPWNKLEEGDDKWEGMYQAKEVDGVAPMEKLTMFKKSTPSVRTAYTHKSDDPVTFESHPFVQYHPELAKDLASTDKVNDLPIARQFLGRVDAGAAISWDGETVRNESYIDTNGQYDRTVTMSPTPNMAIPTPAATESRLHRWESAEVIHYEDPNPEPTATSTVTTPAPHTTSPGEQRRSMSNPFFGAGSDPTPRQRSNSIRSRTGSTRSRSGSVTSVATTRQEPPVPKVNKGKGRAIEPFDDEDEELVPMPKIDKGKGRAIEPFDDDPFVDGQMPTFPRPFVPTAGHTHSGSLSSVDSNDRALQSLMAALNVSAEEAQERLRVASMQPSVYSTTSAYTEDEDFTGSFPLPPRVDGTRQYH